MGALQLFEAKVEISPLLMPNKMQNLDNSIISSSVGHVVETVPLIQIR